MRSLEWALIQNDCGLVKRGNFHFRNDFTTIFVVISLVVPPGLSIYIFFMNINFRFIQLDFGEIWKYYSCIDLFPPPFCGIIVLYIISITSPINVTKPTIIIVIIITLIILCLLKKLRAERRASINLWISMYSDSQLPLQELSNIARTEVSPNFRGISWSSSSACWPSSSFTC